MGKAEQNLQSVTISSRECLMERIAPVEIQTTYVDNDDARGKSNLPRLWNSSSWFWKWFQADRNRPNVVRLHRRRSQLQGVGELGVS